MKFLAIIPARGGSKGIKNKNLRKVGNQSLLERAIKSVNDLMDTIVSTDDVKIKDESIKVGAKVLSMRPKHLSEDNSKTIDVIKYELGNYEKIYEQKVDYIFIIEPTSPFREKKHVKNIVDLLKTNKFNSVVTVCDLERKPENIFTKGESLKKYIKNPIHTFDQRQMMNKLCRLNSAVYATNRDLLIKENKLLIDPIGYAHMSQMESINIDTFLDLKFANFIFDEIHNSI